MTSPPVNSGQSRGRKEFEITIFEKAHGPLTKKIRLEGDKVISDGSPCSMGQGSAQRFRFSDLHDLNALIVGMRQCEALALGALRSDLPDKVTIVTKAELNGATQPGIIARAGSNIIYCEKQPAPVLLDFDTKGMPPEVANRLDAAGGFWRTLVGLLPVLETATRVTRFSTSAGLYRTDTGCKIPGSNGQHVYLITKDGADIVRFLTALHHRCWLAGLGWMMVGAAGQLLERSIIDRTVGAPERLVFEGAPQLEPPLAQDAEARRPIAIDGEMVDTVAACPPLTIVEKARLSELRAKTAQGLASAAAKTREEFIVSRSRILADRDGLSLERARAIIERQCGGIFLPNIVLPFDDRAFAEKTVGDVLADPARFDGETLADPLDAEYGPCKAYVRRHADGTPFIHSLAHGLNTIYELRYDAAAIEAAIDAAGDDDVVDRFVRLVLAGDLGEHDRERLRDKVASRAGAGKRTIDRMLARALKEHQQQRAAAEKQRRAAERRDPRRRSRSPKRTMSGCRRCPYSTTFWVRWRGPNRRRGTPTRRLPKPSRAKSPACTS